MTSQAWGSMSIKYWLQIKNELLVTSALYWKHLKKSSYLHNEMFLCIENFLHWRTLTSSSINLIKFLKKVSFWLTKLLKLSSNDIFNNKNILVNQIVK